MEQRSCMRKKKKKSTKSSPEKVTRLGNMDGFNNLIDVHTQALENNSLKIIEALEVLSTKHLRCREMEEFNKIKGKLNRIDKELKNLGD